jgi:hypothetical protein
MLGLVLVDALVVQKAEVRMTKRDTVARPVVRPGE